jgi:hypothetical protein
MKGLLRSRAFWVGGAIGLAMPFLILIPDQIFPTRLYYILWPAGLVASSLHTAFHAFFSRFRWADVVVSVVGYGGNFLVFALLAGMVRPRRRASASGSDLFIIRQ